MLSNKFNLLIAFVFIFSVTAIKANNCPPVGCGFNCPPVGCGFNCPPVGC